ncbi:rcc01693 family protein [Aliiroseovarius sp. PTFE2010]|uniref:rcc01693 family protein n=1 Tax=Aliiroseovarius sp. PTFE2010 TaxID=3417190 RepID=UPI003CF6F1C4
MSGAQGFDWPALMRAGFRGLGLRPDEFWRLTPAELLMMLGQGATSAPMGRTRLEELAAAFPDASETKGSDKWTA